MSKLRDKLTVNCYCCSFVRPRRVMWNRWN